jgi:tripartite-type tricarboxylate transporter receptor subunit TctC
MNALKLMSILGLTTGLALASTTAAAQWPDKPVHLVVPYTPGAMGDNVARLLADALRKTLGQTVLVENRAGAGGNIGAAAVAAAAPDGYTFMVAATNNFVVNQFLFSNFKYDPLKAFDPVTMLVDVPSVLFMSAAVPVDSFKQFVEWAHSHPGAANYGSPGNGTTPHLSLFAIDKAMNLGMTHVPFQGSTPAIQALLGNQVQVYLGGAGLGLPYVRDGKLKALAVSASSRLDVLPDTPTFEQVGLGAVKASNWWAMAAPHGTPKPIVDRMASEVRTALESPTMRARLAEWGVFPVAAGPAAMQRQLDDEVKLWQRAVAESGAKAD